MRHVRFSLICLLAMFGIALAGGAAYAAAGCEVPKEEKIGSLVDTDRKMLTICWKTENVKGVTIASDSKPNEPIAVPNPGTTSSWDIPMRPGTKDFYKVTVKYSSPDTTFSKIEEVELPPNLPTGLVATVLNDRVELKWEKVEGTNVYYKVAISWAGGKPEKLATQNIHWTFIPKKYGVPHTCTVTAQSDGGSSVASLEFTPQEEPLNVHFITGSEMTSYTNTLSNQDKNGVFSKPWPIYAIEAEYQFGEMPPFFHWFHDFEGIFKLRAATIQTDQTKDGKTTGADMVNLDIGFRLKRTKGNATGYVKILPGFVIPQNPMVKESFIENDFFGFGTEYAKRDSVFYKSYLEVGFGPTGYFAEKNGNQILGPQVTGRLKINGRLYVLDINNLWNGLRGFLGGSVDMDMGSTADEFRVMAGVEQDIYRIFDILGGKKQEPQQGEGQ